MGVRHHHGHQGAAAAGAGTGDIMGRPAWRHGRSRAPFRPRRAVHRPRVRHRGRGMRHASLDRHGRRLVTTPWPRAPTARTGPSSSGGASPSGILRDLELATFQWVSWRGPQTAAPVLGLQDTGTDRNRVLCKPSGANRPTIRAEQKSGHIKFHADSI